MWLDEDEGDGLIERELYEMVSLRQKKQKSEWLHSTHRSLLRERKPHHSYCSYQKRIQVAFYRIISDSENKVSDLNS